MRDDSELDVYEEWNITPPILPSRSILYALEPCGTGTPWVESMTSYITRLAEAHGVLPGILMNKVIAPSLAELFPHRSQQSLLMTDGKRSTFLNAAWVRTADAIHTLEMLTRRTDLHVLTLWTWMGVIHTVGLMRSHRAWCPGCYEEWRTAGQIVYEPLLWALQEISICSHHHQRLQQSCPYQDCARLQPWLAWQSRPGYCAYCYRWLGEVGEPEPSASVIPEEELVWQQWIAQQVGALFAATPMVENPPTRRRVAEVLALCVQQVFHGDERALSQTLDVSEGQVAHWLRHEKLPLFATLLRLCHGLGLSLCEFLLEDVATLHHRLKPQKVVEIRPRSTWQAPSKEQIQQALQAVLTGSESPPPSLFAIARRLGCDVHLLTQCDRQACQTISTQYRAYVQARKEASMQRYREEIRCSARSLHAQGISVTKKHVEPLLTKSGYLRSPELRAFLAEVRRELEEEP